MTSVHSTWFDDIARKNFLEAGEVLENTDREMNILCSYVFSKTWDEWRGKIKYHSWLLDSGAFSAFSQGKVIDIDAYADYCLEVMREDRQAGMFSLDDIKDWRISVRNTEHLWKKGVPVIPVFHRGEPQSLLMDYAKAAKKIALGGIVRDRKGSGDWIDACFSAIWPHKIHGLGCGGRTTILRFPWHSVDTSEWMGHVMRACRWSKYGQLGQPEKRTDICLISQIEHIIKIQREAKARWGKMLEPLEEDHVQRDEAVPVRRQSPAEAELRKPVPKRSRP